MAKVMASLLYALMLMGGGFSLEKFAPILTLREGTLQCCLQLYCNYVVMFRDCQPAGA